MELHLNTKMIEVLRAELSHALTTYHVAYKHEYAILSPLTFFSPLLEKNRESSTSISSILV